MALHVIAGAGAIGRGVAHELVAAGHTVRLVSRSGRGPDHPDIERVALDAADADALIRVTEGAEMLYNCMNPQYHQWAQAWPPLSRSLIATAEHTGAGLVTMANLYNYGRVEAPMTEETPEIPNGTKGEIRRRMWAEAKRANDEGRIRATEVRASDFIGPNTPDTSYLSKLVFPKVRDGGTVRWLFNTADAPHSWTYTRDIARALVVVGQDDRSWGHVWHVPTNAPRTAREVAADAARVLAVTSPKVTTTPTFALRAMGLAVPFIRELAETRHQFEGPFVLDSTRTRQTFGLKPTPWEEVLRTSLAVRN